MFIDAAGLIFFSIGIVYFLKYNASVRSTALFIGISPIIFNALYRVIMANVYDKPLSGIFTLTDIIVAVLRLILAFVILLFVSRNEESGAMTWAILASGGILSYAILPSVMPWVVALF